jgi:hypothetical protein
VEVVTEKVKTVLKDVAARDFRYVDTQYLNDYQPTNLVSENGKPNICRIYVSIIQHRKCEIFSCKIELVEDQVRRHFRLSLLAAAGERDYTGMLGS